MADNNGATLLVLHLLLEDENVAPPGVEKIYPGIFGRTNSCIVPFQPGVSN